MGKRVRQKKLEFEKNLNMIFGTNIRWSKLPYDDLVEFANVLLSKKFCKKVCRGSQNVLQGMFKMIDKLIPPDEQGPILRALKTLSGVEESGEES